MTCAGAVELCVLLCLVGRWFCLGISPFNEIWFPFSFEDTSTSFFNVAVLTFSWFDAFWFGVSNFT